jgi:hypothetical protein
MMADKLQIGFDDAVGGNPAVVKDRDLRGITLVE